MEELRQEGQERLVARVVDERRSQRIRLDRVALAILRLLDGTRDPSEILADLERRGIRIHPSLLRKTLEFFERSSLLEGAAPPGASGPGRQESSTTAGEGTEGARIVLRADPGETPEAPRVDFLEGLRHECVACGMCCRGYQLGPLTQEEVGRLRRERFVEEGARLDASRRVVEREIEGEKRYLLELQENGACVFLGADGQCILHKEKGSAAKPWFCQVFPVRFVLAPDGRVSGHLQMECFSYHQARRRGPRLAEDTETVRRLLSSARDVSTLPRDVRVGERRTLRLQEYYLVEERVLGLLKERALDLDARIHAVGRLLRWMEEGNRVGDFDPPTGSRPLVANDRLVLEVAAFGRSRAALAPPVVLAARPDGTSSSMRSFFLDALEYFSGEGDVSHLLAVERVRGPEGHPECAEVLEEFLGNEVFSKEWYRSGDLRVGFAWTLVRYLLTVAGARVLAHRWGDEEVSPKALCHSMSRTLRSLRGGWEEKTRPREISALARIHAALLEA